MPDADIVVLSSAGLDGDVELLDGYAWAVQEMGVTVGNHSWTVTSGGYHRDGTSLLAKMIDEASAEGVVQVCAASNDREARAHAMRTSAFQFDFGVSVGSNAAGYSKLEWDVVWQDPNTELSCTLYDPADTPLVIDEAQNATLGSFDIDIARTDSGRTSMIAMRIVRTDGGSLGSESLGLWRLECEHDGGDEQLFHAFIEPVNGAGPLSLVGSSTRYTVGPPSTADTCIVAAGYLVSGGGLASYSSQGPRVDEAAVVDVAGPVDAVAPIPSLDYGDNRFGMFGGTSSASPHTAAIAALLQGTDPDLTPRQIKTMIQEGAHADQHVGSGELPDDSWGYGKLRGYQALTGQAPPIRPEPKLIALDVRYTYRQGDCAVTFDVQGASWEQASFRWDFDYDGLWDTDFEPEPTTSITVSPEDNTFHLRVDAAQAGWILAGATLQGQAPPECFEEPPDEVQGTGSSEEPEGSTGDAPAAGSAGGCGCQESQRMPVGALLFLLLTIRRNNSRSRLKSATMA